MCMPNKIFRDVWTKITDSNHTKSKQGSSTLNQALKEFTVLGQAFKKSINT